MGRFVLLWTGWLALGAYWLIRLVAALLTGSTTTLRRSWRGWAIPVAVVGVTAGSLWTWTPLLLRFNVSQAAMDDLAREVTSSSTTSRPDRVGLYSVGRVQRFEDGMRFIVRGAGFIDKYGFAYSPDGRPPNLGEDNYVHLEGPWYVWEESW